MNRDKVWSVYCVVVVVLIDGGLRGGIDLTVLQDMVCAQGQLMGMVLGSARRR